MEGGAHPQGRRQAEPERCELAPLRAAPPHAPPDAWRRTHGRRAGAARTGAQVDGRRPARADGDSSEPRRERTDDGPPDDRVAASDDDPRTAPPAYAPPPL